MMLKNIAIFLFFSLIANFAYSSSDGIVVVNMQKVLKESLAAKDVRAKIRQKRDVYQAQITQREEELRSAEKKLAEQRALLDKDTFKAKTDEFKKQLISAQRDFSGKRNSLDRALSKSLGVVQKSVLEVIADLAKKKGFRLAVPTSQILFFGGELDITTEVIEKLNKRLPTVEIEEDK